MGNPSCGHRVVFGLCCGKSVQYCRVSDRTPKACRWRGEDAGDSAGQAGSGDPSTAVRHPRHVPAGFTVSQLGSILDRAPSHTRQNAKNGYDLDRRLSERGRNPSRTIRHIQWKEPNVPRFLTTDTVAALLAHFPEDQFKSTSTELQAGFRQVALEFPALFGAISFGKVGAYVSSPTIEAALDSLAASGFYSRYNKNLVTYDLDKEKLKSYYNDFLEGRFGEAGIELNTIKQASQELHDALKTIHKSKNLERLLVVG